MSKEIDPREPKRAVAYELWMKAPNLIDAKDLQVTVIKGIEAKMLDFKQKNT